MKQPRKRLASLTRGAKKQPWHARTCAHLPCQIGSDGHSGSLNHAHLIFFLTLKLNLTQETLGLSAGDTLLSVALLIFFLFLRLFIHFFVCRLGGDVSGNLHQGRSAGRDQFKFRPGGQIRVDSHPISLRRKIGG